MKIISTILVAIFAAAAVFAEIKTPALFSDNMMFQSGAPIKLWGAAAPGAEVKVEFAGQSASAKAGADGKWRAQLAPEKGSAVPRDVLIYENGTLAKKISNVLVGQLWIAGGQSNMEFQVRYSFDCARAKKAAAKLAGKMRYFIQTSDAVARQPQENFFESSRWLVPAENNVESFSAVGFYFAEKLSENIDEPVGIIYASKGATRMFSWISHDYMQKTPFAKAELEKFAAELAAYTPEVYKQKCQKHKDFMKTYKAAKASKTPLNVPWDAHIPPHPLTPRHTFASPYLHYNGAVAPLGDFSVKGVIWYQGESDTGKPLIDHYIENFKLVVDCWRNQFANPNLVFILTELASYGTPTNWAPARACELECSKVLKNCHTSPLVDSGEERDIHPRDKTIVGRRMADIALNKVYGKKSFYCDAPEVSKVSISGARARVEVNTFGRGLVAKGAPRGFEALVEGKWQPADAALKGETIVVKSRGGRKIDGVRYLWKSWTLPDACIFNKDGLPLWAFDTTFKP